MKQFRTRVFPTARRLARIHAMPESFLHHCLARGGDMPESIEHFLLECPRWECHRRSFWTLAPESSGFVRQIATSPEDINALLLGGAPPPFMAPFILQEMGGFPVMAPSPPSYCFLCSFVSHSRNVLLREMGLGPSRITRMGRRPDG
jgi:hypothetical protein